jgi:hypothetical protein
MALSARARGTGMVVDVHIWRGSLGGAIKAMFGGVGGVGHAIATGYKNPHSIWVNMWPAGQGVEMPWDPKVLAVLDSYSGTVKSYGRLADNVFSIHVPKGNNFSVAAMDHRKRKYWDTLPAGSKDETNCSFSVWDCLTRGGIKIGVRPLDPDDLLDAIKNNLILLNGIWKNHG